MERELPNFEKVKMLIPIDVGAAQESKPVPTGIYDLQIADAQETKSQKGAPQFKISIAVIGHDDAPNVTHFVSLPSEADEPGKQQFKVLLLKRFLTLFKLPIPNAIDTEKMAMGMVGAKAKAEVTLGEPDKESGNVYNRLVVPRLANEGAAKESVPPPPKR